MKIIRSKSFLTLLIILFVIGFSTSANSLIGFPGLLPFGHYTVTKAPGEINPLSVVYPASLQDYRKQTKEYIKAFSKKEREYIIHIFSKGKNFFPKALEVLEKYNVPQEFQMIPVLESEFNANAVSPVGAVGHWQFMSTLAKEYGLHTGGKYDERRNFTKSTVAAAKFFRDQLDYFNEDLLLCVAAYNCGPGRVRSSIKKCGKEDPTYWDIKRYLPSETRKFVMNFIALNVIFTNYEKFLNKDLNFNEPPLIQIASSEDSTISKDSFSDIAL
ncbi:MAG: lytic transglycosylase domain-containing protein [Ginsengibacter sp.]